MQYKSSDAQYLNSFTSTELALCKNLQQLAFTSPIKLGKCSSISSTTSSSASSVCSSTKESLIMQQQQQQLQQQSSMQTRYKTELCRSFQENGTCKYGEKCQFAHGVHELRNMNRHPKYKTELCRTFHTYGYCPYGPRCHFVHDNIQNHMMNLEKQQQNKTNSMQYSQQLQLPLASQQSSGSQDSCSSSTSVTPPSSRSLSPDYQTSERPMSLLNRLMFSNSPVQQQGLYDANLFAAAQQQMYEFNLFGLKF